MPSPEWETDRPRGILTPEQRRFILESPEDLPPEVTRQRRYRIRRQVKNAILDFGPLVRLPIQDRELIFEGYVDADTLKQADLDDVHSGIYWLLGFVLENVGRGIFLEYIRLILESYIRDEYVRQGKHLNEIGVEFDITTDTTPLFELREKYNAGGELTLEEMTSLAVREIDVGKVEKAKEYLSVAQAKTEQRMGGEADSS